MLKSILSHTISKNLLKNERFFGLKFVCIFMILEFIFIHLVFIEFLKRIRYDHLKRNL